MADQELLHFLKLKKTIQLFQILFIMIRPVSSCWTDEKEIQLLPSIKKNTQKLAMIHFHLEKYPSLERALSIIYGTQNVLNRQRSLLSSSNICFISGSPQINNSSAEDYLLHRTVKLNIQKIKKYMHSSSSMYSGR